MSLPGGAFLSLCTLIMASLAIARWPSRSMLFAVPCWFVGLLVSELAAPLGVGLAIWGVLLIVLGALGSTAGQVALPLALLAEAGLATHVKLALGARAEAERALDGLPASSGRRLPRLHVALPWLLVTRRGVRRRRRVVHSRVGRRKLRCDIYQPRRRADPGERRPAIVNVHGGGWIAGSRNEQGIVLLNHLAAHGWVGFNVDYRLSPWATWPDQIVDVKRAIAWVREHASEYGADPDFVCITGGSAGGHLSALAALTPGDPDFQPGFESADTRVQAAVPFYGWYDMTDADGIHMPWVTSLVLERMMFKTRKRDGLAVFTKASPYHRVHEGAPPFLIIHGTRDSLIDVSEGRSLARELGAVSTRPVHYLELAGAQHAFDLLPSIRMAAVVSAVERFLGAIRAEHLRAAQTSRAPATSTRTPAPAGLELGPGRQATGRVAP